jgi:DNA modification methylase
MNYDTFLKSKVIDFKSQGFDPINLNPYLKPFQSDIVTWACKLGRSAVFCACGLGKTIMQLAWAEQVCNHTGGKVLVLTPLAVAAQTVREGEKFGIDARVSRDGELLDSDRIVITNYESLHKFSAVDFDGIVLDESSILKSFTSSTRNQIIGMFNRTPFKLACTATPSPNDHMELGNHAEFLGVMSRTEMLSTFFVHDGGDTSKWRLKGHAKNEFWKWMAKWAVMMESPINLGYEDDGYDLPPLIYHEHTIDNGDEVNGGLLIRRQARRESMPDRVNETATLVNSSDDQWIVWCDLNDEGDMLEKAIPDSVQIAGKHSDKFKEESMMKFIDGSIRVLISKPSIMGFGMNFQNCHKMAFVGLSDSYELLHQALKRCHRFGQKYPVDAHIVISSKEGAVLRNIQRKEQDGKIMMESMIKHISINQDLHPTSRQSDEYKTDVDSGDNWTIHLGDCVEVANKIADNSLDYSIFSPPFSSLYTYSNSDRDMGNSRSTDEFHAHFKFLVRELYRTLKPGRLVSFHCMNLPSSKQHDGVIGLKDFRGDLIRDFQQEGFIYHSEVVIWKNPVTAMQRTKAIGLLHKQLNKDSCMSRQGVPDYLVTMRKPGENPDPVSGLLTYFAGDEIPDEVANADDDVRKSINIWQRYASPVWMDINPSRTLQKGSAREHDDERHICPLQLDVIERAMQLWTMPGDLVFSPFTGIGSEGYVAIEMGRKFVGAELKPSYFNQAIANLKSLDKAPQQQDLLQLIGS